MRMATQPASTRLSRQLQDETLPVLYSSNIFVANIDTSHVSLLVRFEERVSPCAAAWKVRIAVRLLADTHCLLSLYELAKTWSEIDHHRIQFTVHHHRTQNSLGTWRTLHRARTSPHTLVVKVVRLAESSAGKEASLRDDASWSRLALFASTIAQSDYKGLARAVPLGCFFPDSRRCACRCTCSD